MEDARDGEEDQEGDVGAEGGPVFEDGVGEGAGVQGAAVEAAVGRGRGCRRSGSDGGHGGCGSGDGVSCEAEGRD